MMIPLLDPAPTPVFFSAIAWRSSRKKANPPKKEDVVDLGSKFGMSFGSDSDSSDAEFAPENETIDSDGMVEEHPYSAWHDVDRYQIKT